jgi:hypothetical protein
VIEVAASSGPRSPQSETFGFARFPAWQVGARFVCTKCWVRGTHATCARCGQAALDVGGAGGFTVLDGRWRSYAAFVRGRAMVSPFAAHRLPVVAGLSVAVGLAAAAAPIVGMAVRPQASEPAMFAVAAGMGLICLPFVAMFFGAFLVLYANVCRLLGALVGLIPTPLGFGRARVNLVAAIFDFIANVLLCPIAVGEAPKRRAVEGGGEVGTLVEPLTVHLRRDSLSFAERFDAWVDGPLTVRVGAMPPRRRGGPTRRAVRVSRAWRCCRRGRGWCWRRAGWCSVSGALSPRRGEGWVRGPLSAARSAPHPGPLTAPENPAGSAPAPPRP